MSSESYRGSSRTIVTAILLAFVAVSIIYFVIKETTSKPDQPEQTVVPGRDSTDTSPQGNPPGDKFSSRKVVAYYFHGNTRCMTCRTIEAYTKEAIDTAFAEALKDNRLEWQIINLEEPNNKHFIRDFQLVTRSVVIEEIADGKRTRWKNLQRVWELVRDKGVFQKYIQDETRAYLEDSGQ